MVRLRVERGKRCSCQASLAIIFVRSSTPLLAAAVCVLCLAAIASPDALSRQAKSLVEHPVPLSSSTLNEMMPDDKLFENVPFNTNKQTACSQRIQISTGLE
jgi:hypothetical protein